MYIVLRGKISIIPIRLQHNGRQSQALQPIWLGRGLVNITKPTWHILTNFNHHRMCKDCIFFYFNKKYKIHFFELIHNIIKLIVCRIGHFTVMVADKNNRLGCAVARYTQAGVQKTYLAACVYSYTNLSGLPIYRKGPVASQCVTGRNPKYPALCSVNEPSNYKPFE